MSRNGPQHVAILGGLWWRHFHTTGEPRGTFGWQLTVYPRQAYSKTHSTNNLRKKSDKSKQERKKKMVKDDSFSITWQTVGLYV
jgi:hypothetical protein